jgi:hypothetical protein
MLVSFSMSAFPMLAPNAKLLLRADQAKARRRPRHPQPDRLQR